jgi:hypothetical protein
MSGFGATIILTFTQNPNIGLSKCSTWNIPPPPPPHVVILSFAQNPSIWGSKLFHVEQFSALVTIFRAKGLSYTSLGRKAQVRTPQGIEG